MTDDALLDPRQSNYLAAVAHEAQGRDRSPPQARVGIAWVELSTGRFQAATFQAAQLADELTRIDPAECLVDQSAAPLPPHLTQRMMVTARPSWSFSRDAAAQSLSKQFGTAGLEGFGLEETQLPAVRAAGAIVDYLQETQRSSLEHIDRIALFRAGGSLEIDEATRRSLEITRTLRDGGREGSLLAVLDRTVTAMGSRQLAEWLGSPLTDVQQIDHRLDAVEELLGDAVLCEDLRCELRGIYDMQRLLGRVMTGRASPRDLSHVGKTLRILPRIKARLSAQE